MYMREVRSTTRAKDRTCSGLCAMPTSRNADFAQRRLYAKTTSRKDDPRNEDFAQSRHCAKILRAKKLR